MATQQETIVRIEHKDGRRYAISEYAFKHTKIGALGDQTYEQAGFTIASYEDGTAYGGDEKPSDYAVNASAREPEIGSVEKEEAATLRTERSARAQDKDSSATAEMAPEPVVEPTPAPVEAPVAPAPQA